MVEKIRVILFGLGPMGKTIARYAISKKWIEVVGAVDVNSELVGKNLGDIVDLDGRTAVVVTNDPDILFSKIKADIAIHATVSDLTKAFSQYETIIKAGIDIVSTCEELAFPYLKYDELSKKIDSLAKKHKVSILATGINPGYLMDTLPITLTGICQEVKKVKVTRMMDSSKRRIPFQKKIGTGLTVEEFRRMIDQRLITGHVGLSQSISMMAATFNWKLDEIVEHPPQPVIADREIKTPYTTVKLGNVAGLRSSAYATINGIKVIELDFQSHAAVKEEFDSVEIEGVPNVKEVIHGGIHGDIGTAAIVVNSIPKVINARPGLLTMLDLPIPSFVP